MLSVLTAVGTAGIPGGSLPMVMFMLHSLGIPVEGIGIILGIDRLLDMGRTVVNVTGDIVTTVIIAKSKSQKENKFT